MDYPFPPPAIGAPSAAVSTEADGTPETTSAQDQAAAPPSKRARLLAEWRAADKAAKAAAAAFAHEYYEDWWLQAGPIWNAINTDLRNAVVELGKKRTKHTRETQQQVIDQIARDLVARANAITEYTDERLALLTYIHWTAIGRPYHISEPVVPCKVMRDGREVWYGTKPLFLKP